MRVTLRIWRQKDAQAEGRLETHEVSDVSPDMSFLELLDVLNEELVMKGDEPIAFDHDCREGICGTCSLVIDGEPHGKERGTTACQLHMRHYDDGDVITVEPWRAKAFPLIRDLVVDRVALDRVIEAGGYVSINTGAPQDANALPIAKTEADTAMDAAACIGCGACVAACKNASAMLFLSAKVAHLAHLPQGQPERSLRVQSMINAADAEAFGACSNTYDCEAACPKEISVRFISEMHRDYCKSLFCDS